MTHTNYGLPSYEVGDKIEFINPIASAKPAFLTEDRTFAADVVLPAFAPVALDAEDNVVGATQGTPAIGVTIAPVDTSAGAADFPVAIQGNFNPAGLAWDASYTTRAQKLAAFRGAPAPTQIIVTPTVG